MKIPSLFLAHLAVLLALLAALTCSAPCGRAVSPIVFRIPPTFPVGDGPAQIASGDLNDDGLPDLATANSDDNTVSVLLGQGKGTFAPASHYATGTYPDALALGDVNGDGHLDVVTANANGWNQPGSLGVLLGRGDGTLEPVKHLTVDRGPRGIVLADFNGDGHLDLATAISGGWTETNKVNVLLGHGDGTFDAATRYDVGMAPAWIATGDFNGDGHPDLVTANAGPGANGSTVSVLLNRGDGTFASAATYSVGTYPGFVLVADFNGDSKPDLAVGNRASASVSLLLGQGHGTFNPAVPLPVSAGVTQLAAGDFNQDGRPDLAVLGGSSSAGAVTILLGNGVGGFGVPVTYSVGAGLQALGAADLNGDHRLDLVVAGAYDNAILLLAGKGDGTFQSFTDTYPVGTSIQRLVTGDFNQDGQLDIATADLTSSSVNVLLQDTNSQFLPAKNFSVGTQPRSLKAADFNRDGCTDLVSANFDGTLTVLLGQRTPPGGFLDEWDLSGYVVVMNLGSNHTDVAVGDFNGDGKLDLVTPNYYGASLSVGTGQGDGSFLPGAYLTVNPGPSCVLVDDFNGDGQADIAVGYDSGWAISLLVGRGDGTFAPKQDIPTWELPHFIASADINFDGKPDLIAAHYDWRRVSVMLNQSPNTGPLRFASAVTHEVANDPVCLAVGDFNGDNLPDIVSGNYASTSVLLGQGDGTFATVTNYFMGGAWAAAGDFNQDGMPDVAMDLGGKVGLLWNDTLPRLQIAPVPGGVRVAYPAWKFYTLEANSGVAQSNAWRLVTNTPALFGSQYVLTNSLDVAGQVYRLKRPLP